MGKGKGSKRGGGNGEGEGPKEGGSAGGGRTGRSDGERDGRAQAWKGLGEITSGVLLWMGGAGGELRTPFLSFHSLLKGGERLSDEREAFLHPR